MPISQLPGTVRFVSPLTDAQHAQLGRISVLWGHIDYLLDHLIAAVSRLSWEQIESLKVNEKPLGAKVGFLKASLHQVTDDKHRALVETFIELVGGVKERRNFALHGLWGIRSDNRLKSVAPAARLHADVTKPFRASQLGKLEADLCAASSAAIIADAELQERTYSELERLVFYAESDAPQWLQQWLIHNPLNYVTLDYSGAAKELPRRVSPYLP